MAGALATSVGRHQAADEALQTIHQEMSLLLGKSIPPPQPRVVLFCTRF